MHKLPSGDPFKKEKVSVISWAIKTVKSAQHLKGLFNKNIRREMIPL